MSINSVLSRRLSPDPIPEFARDIISLIPGEYAFIDPLVLGIGEVTPDAASLILEVYGNKNNRNLVKANLARIRDSMRDRVFLLNGESVIFGYDGSGVLLTDGHTRLTACVESGASFRSVIVIGSKTSTITTLDAGSARTDSHRLTMDSHKNGSVLNGAIQLLASWCRSQAFSRSTPIHYHRKVNYWLAGNPKLVESAQFAQDHKSALAFYRSPLLVAFLHYVTSAASVHYGEPLAECFWDSIISKQNPSRPGGKVIGFLIDRLVNENGPRTGISRQALDLEKRSLYTFMAWNAFCRGEDIGKLQFPKEGKCPRILGLHYVGNVPFLYDFHYTPDAESRCDPAYQEE